MVGGPTRDVTRLMRLVPGLLVKDGAEGVQVAALPDGRAIAAQDRRRWRPGAGAGDDRRPALARRRPSPADALPQPILGHGRPVGCVRSLVGEP